MFALLVHCENTGCSPFEVFYGRVSNAELAPLLTDADLDSESEYESDYVRKELNFVMQVINKLQFD